MRNSVTKLCVTVGILLAFVLSLSGFCAAQPSSNTTPPEITYLQIVARKYSLTDPAIPQAILASLNRPLSQTFTDAQGRVWEAMQHRLVVISPDDGLERVMTGKDGLPIPWVTGVVGGPDGKLWLATPEGLILFVPDAAVQNHRWYYFWGKRYLSDNRVLQVVAGKNQAWVRTKSGISSIAFEPYSLKKKADLFQSRVRKRYGYVSGWDLLRPGDPTSFRLRPDDNDGLWTSMYVAAQCLRYKTTHSAEALQDARTSLKALLRLVSITGIPGFPARSLIHRGDYLPPGGEWHWTADGQWKWKGDTSSDELVGHFMAYWLAYNLLPDNGDRAKIRSAVSSIASGLIEHNWQLIGYGGKVTTWGKYDPAYLDTLVPREKALNSLEILSHIRVAYAITGDKKFLDAYHTLVDKMGYVKNVQAIGDLTDPVNINYSDHELAFLSFYPLLEAETDPQLRRQYQAAEAKLWHHARSEKDPLWNFIYARGNGTKDYACADAMETLERIPLSTITWTVKNSQRDDLTLANYVGRSGEAQSLHAIPRNESGMTKWNGDPFDLNGGNGGRGEDDGTFFLLPYWFGRYYHLIPCKQ